LIRVFKIELVFDKYVLLIKQIVFVNNHLLEKTWTNKIGLINLN